MEALRMRELPNPTLIGNALDAAEDTNVVLTGDTNARPRLDPDSLRGLIDLHANDILGHVVALPRVAESEITHAVQAWFDR